MIAASKEFGLLHLSLTVVPVIVGFFCTTGAGGPGNRKEERKNIRRGKEERGTEREGERERGRIGRKKG